MSFFGGGGVDPPETNKCDPPLKKYSPLIFLCYLVTPPPNCIFDPPYLEIFSNPPARLSVHILLPIRPFTRDFLGKIWVTVLQTDKCPNPQKSGIFHPERVLSLHTKAVHLREKPQECEFCQNIFSLKSSLQKHIAAFPLSLHIKAVHLKEKPQECEFCQNIFSLKSSMQKHIAAFPLSLDVNFQQTGHEREDYTGTVFTTKKSSVQCTGPFFRKTIGGRNPFHPSTSIL